PTTQLIDGRNQVTSRERVFNPHDVVEQSAALAARWILDDATQAHVGQRCRRADKAQRGLESEGGDENDRPHGGESYPGVARTGSVCVHARPVPRSEERRVGKEERLLRWYVTSA